MSKLITWSIILIILAIVAWPIDFLTLVDDPTSNSIQHLLTGIVSGLLLVVGIILLIVNKYKK